MKSRELFAILGAAIMILVILLLLSWKVFQLFDIGSALAYFLVFGAGGILIWGFKPRIYRFFRPQQEPSTQVTQGPQGIRAFTREQLQRELPLGDFLSQAKDKVLILTASGIHIAREEREHIKKVIMDGRTVVILLMNPNDLNSINKVNSDWSWDRLQTDISLSLADLSTLRQELGELERNRLIVRLYDRVPTTNLIILDPKSEDARVQAGMYMTGTDPTYRLFIVFHRRGNERLYEKYQREWEYFYDTASKKARNYVWPK